MPAILAKKLPVSGLMIYFTGSVEIVDGIETETGGRIAAAVGSSSLFIAEAHEFATGIDAEHHSFHLNTCGVSSLDRWSVFELPDQPDAVQQAT